MSEFDSNEIVEVPEGLLELNNDSNSIDLYINDHLKVIDDKLLEGLAKKLSYSDSFHAQAWKHNVFVEVGWRKAL